MPGCFMFNDFSVADFDSLLTRFGKQKAGGCDEFSPTIIEVVDFTRNLPLLNDYQTYLRVEKACAR